MALCVFGIGAAVAQAQPAGMAPTSSLRLIGGGGLDHGHYEAGVEIAMPPGSHTYWRNPGESGVPPVFSFNGSTNVASAEVAFPIPMRISEDGLEAFGYTSSVVFPVSVTPNDPSKPSALKVEATYAVCNKICIPAQGSASLTLPAKDGPRTAARVAVALGEVPRPMSDAQRADLSVEPDTSDKDSTWVVSWKGAEKADDLFAVAPAGFYFSTKRAGPHRWILSAEQSVTVKGAAKVPVSLVVANKDKSLVTTETLDLTKPKK